MQRNFVLGLATALGLSPYTASSNYVPYTSLLQITSFTSLLITTIVLLILLSLELSHRVLFQLRIMIWRFLLSRTEMCRIRVVKREPYRYYKCVASSRVV
jgi:hypothetical protein